MPRAPRDFRRRCLLAVLLMTLGVALALAAGHLFIAYQAAHPAPPSHAGAHR